MDVQALDSKGSAHDGTHECEFDKQNYHADVIYDGILFTMCNKDYSLSCCCTELTCVRHLE
jgi:hypothetical protein